MDGQDEHCVEFWFDFASGYAYFGAHDLLNFAKRYSLRIVWRPFMLGSAFKVTGATGLSSTPLKAEYAKHDWARLARLQNLPFTLHDEHPRITLPAMRAFYWIERRSAEVAGHFAMATLNAYFQDARDMGDLDAVVELGSNFGFQKDQIRRGVNDPEIKALARAKSEEAIARGVFGSPFFFLEGEPFWGWDRIPLMEKWLVEEGW